MNKFEISSRLERSYIKRLAERLGMAFCPLGHYSPIDAILSREGGDADEVLGIEAKVRNYRSTDFETAILEKGKYDSMIGIATSKMCYKVVYCMFWQRDDVATIWNVTTVVPRWESSKFVKTSMGNREEVYKQVTFLPLSSAVTIKLSN